MASGNSEGLEIWGSEELNKVELVLAAEGGGKDM